MARLIKLNESVTRGEKKTLEYLQRALPSDWVVFGNPRVTTSQLTRELDAIVVGDRCVWVIDEKGFGGIITGDEFTWVLQDGTVRERALDNIRHAASMVKGKLTASDPKLRTVWVEGIIILSANGVELRVRDPRASRQVTRLAGCEGYFLRANIPNANPLSPAEIDAVVKALSGTNVLDRIQQRFEKIGPYHLVETLSSSHVAQTFRAEHERLKESVELKLYDLSSLPDQQTAERVRRQAEREFQALRKLRATEGIVRIAESFQAVTGYGGELYYLALDLPDGPCLAARLIDETWPLTARLAAGRRLCEIMRSVHQAGVIHRNLSPACIYLWRSESDFQLTGFDFSRLPTSTLHLSSDDFPTNPYTAPEVTDTAGNASIASDIYSLGVILYEMFSGSKPFGNRTRMEDDQEPRLTIKSRKLSDKQIDDINSLIQLMLSYKPGDRPQSLDDVIAWFDELSDRQEEEPKVNEPVRHPMPQGKELGRFVILGYLGAGGCFHVYKVASRADDSHEYVAKVVKFPELLSTARREFQVLSSLEHRNIIKAEEVSMMVDAPYHLLESYAPGLTAAEYISQGSTEAVQVAKWAAELADALVYMETRNPPAYHGDISPRNIVINNDHPLLVDFGLGYLGSSDLTGGVVGTAPYRPPERDIPSSTWPVNGDIYSLGVVLCELLFGDLPYKHEGGQWDKSSIREELFESRGHITKELLALLRKAIAPRSEERFQSAAEFQKALEDVPELSGRLETSRQLRGVVDYLSDVLKVYNRGGCNAENRGMDSVFAKATYVPTELDVQLLPHILAYKYALVVLAGNPGDGKTAFLQQLAMKLGYEGDRLPLNHWVIERDDWTFECVLDGSASDTERNLATSDQVLNDLFRPLRIADATGALVPQLRRTQLLAINDGRLLEYLEDCDDGDWVASHLLRLLGEEEGEAHPGIILVDLNRRSLVSAERGDTFESILAALLEGGWGDKKAIADPWLVCSQCRAATSCHVRFNVDTLRHPTLGPQVRQRLKTLLKMVHSRGRLHITVRELRSMLAYFIFGDQTCEGIHAELEEGVQPTEDGGITTSGANQLKQRQKDRLYFNRLFIAGEDGGRLLRELKDFDPATVDNPRFDRLVSSVLKSTRRVEDLFESAEGRLYHNALSLEEGFDDQANLKNIHDELRRRAFFEGRASHWSSIAGQEYWLEMTPFRSTNLWVNNLAAFGRGVQELSPDLTRQICRAVSLTDNVPEELLKDYLAIRTSSSSKTDLIVVRLFDINDFHLSWERASTKATIYGELPTAMLLQYGHDKDPTLEIPADMFELLVRFARGYRLGSQELEEAAAHLQLFKNRLLAMPAQEVCLLHPILGFHKASQRLIDGTRQISLEVLA
jgi:serine/threonine protein kinase